jgi:hypothetical protein
MSNVVILPVVTTLDIPAERILTQAIEADLKEAMIIGTSKDGSFFFAATFGDGGNVLWLLEKARIAIMKTTGDL